MFARDMIFVREVPLPTFAIVYFRSLIELKIMAKNRIEDATMAYSTFLIKKKDKNKV